MHACKITGPFKSVCRWRNINMKSLRKGYEKRLRDASCLDDKASFVFSGFCEWTYIAVCEQSSLVSTCGTVKFPHSLCLAHITHPRLMPRKSAGNSCFYCPPTEMHTMWFKKYTTGHPSRVTHRPHLLYPFLNKLLNAPLNCLTLEKLSTNTGIECDAILSACEWHTGMVPAGCGESWRAATLKQLFLERFARRMSSEFTGLNITHTSGWLNEFQNVHNDWIW